MKPLRLHLVGETQIEGRVGGNSSYRLFRQGGNQTCVRDLKKISQKTWKPLVKNLCFLSYFDVPAVPLQIRLLKGPLESWEPFSPDYDTVEPGL